MRPRAGANEPRPITQCRFSHGTGGRVIVCDAERLDRYAKAREAEILSDIDDHACDHGVKMEVLVGIDVIKVQPGLRKGAELSPDLLCELSPDRRAGHHAEGQAHLAVRQQPVLINDMRQLVRRQRWFAVDEDEMEPESMQPVEALIAALIGELGLSEHADQPVETLPYGEKRRLELGLALAVRPSVLLLDEPLTGLSPAEREDIKRLIQSLRKGRTIVLVEHDMDAVFQLAERIMVLHDGRRLAEGDLETIQMDPRVQQAYLGGADF